jgi:Fic family protein
MTDSDGEERHSKPLSADLITDPDQKAEREAENGLRQFDRVVQLVESWIQPDRKFRLRPSTILDLQRVALNGISAYAGVWRPAGIEIGGSKHEPPSAHLVAELIEDLCDYVNENWDKPAIHLCAYCMWRLNWIHPFTDGNGRTSRALSYAVLCIRLGYMVPGPNTIPDQISANKKPYYDALEKADTACAKGQIDVSELEQLLGDLLAKQLVSVHDAAMGKY